MPTASGLPQSFHVVTCFLMKDDRILILKRSQKVGTFKGKWAGVSGFIETLPESQSLLEIYEETGLTTSDIALVKAGLPFEVEDTQNNILWAIHPYLYKVTGQRPISIDWEHFEYKWIKPDELSGFDTVPGLQEALERVLGEEQPAPLESPPDTGA